MYPEKGLIQRIIGEFMSSENAENLEFLNLHLILCKMYVFKAFV